MKAVVFINIGSPDFPEPKAVGKYLRQFLMDKYVMNIPLPIRYLLVNGIIVPFRKNHSAALYQSIWTTEGSPLKVIQNQLMDSVRKLVSSEEVIITQAMRYANPSIENTIRDLAEKNVTDLLFILLYPQNTASTVKTAKEEILKNLNKCLPSANSTFIDSFYENPDYLSCIASSVKEAMAGIQESPKLIFTYHGIPVTHLPCPSETARKCNAEWNGCIWHNPEHKTCYRYQCFRTTEILADILQLKPDSYKHFFQSRLGKGEWLKPYLCEEIKQLPANGIKKVMMIAPSFIIDCLETNYEIREETKNIFLKHGGSDFFYVSCLNDRPDWSFVISQWIKCWLNNSDISKSRVSL